MVRSVREALIHRIRIVGFYAGNRAGRTIRLGIPPMVAAVSSRSSPLPRERKKEEACLLDTVASFSPLPC
jgi:hypothetical protein